MEKQIMQFKITLNDSEPKIWRRIQVPEHYTFWDLHCAIQDMMPWTDTHLHAFYMSKTKDGQEDRSVIQWPDPEWNYGEAYDERTELIKDWFPAKLKQCIYTYDMGDSWDHTILFERFLPREEDSYPKCVAGKNACPPEDCGGIGGYMHLLSIVNNPDVEDEDELREWMGLEPGETIDPTRFNIEDVVFSDPKALLKEFKKHFTY